MAAFAVKAFFLAGVFALAAAHMAEAFGFGSWSIAAGGVVGAVWAFTAD